MALVSSAAADEDALSGTYRAADLRAVKLDLPVAEVRIEGTDGDEVSVAAQIDCTKGGRHCRDAADRVALEVLRTGGELRVGLAGWPDRDCPKGMELAMQRPAPPSAAFVGQAQGG